MSIDCAIINLDRKQFLKPLDMGLRSEIRSVENVPGLFHVAMARLIEGPWAGDRVAMIHDGGRTSGLPSWEVLSDRAEGWLNVLPDVIADLATHRTAILNEQYGGKVAELLETLEDHVRGLSDDLSDVEDAYEEENVVSARASVSREIERTRMMLSRLRGHEIMPMRWADLLWKVPRTELSCTGLQEQWQTLVWQIDDGKPFVFPLYDLGDDQIVFHVRERVLVSFAAQGCVGTLRIGMGRADRAIQVSQSADLLGGDDFVELQLIAPRAADEPVGRAVPCFIAFVDLSVSQVSDEDPGEIAPLVDEQTPHEGLPALEDAPQPSDAMDDEHDADEL